MIWPRDPAVPGAAAPHALGVLLRFVALVVLGVLAGCGFPRPPDVAECTMSSDCTGAGQPFCSQGQCVGSCSLNDECVDLATPLCQASTGRCVGCFDATTCPSERPVCDAQTSTCKACDRDDQCASGVCLEAEGRCAMTSEIVFLQEHGGSVDDGRCEATAPCKTFAGALAATTSERYVIHLTDGAFHMMDGADLSGRRLYIDGSDTIVSSMQNVTFSTAAAGPSITLGRMTINAASGTAISASNNGAIQLYEVTLGAKATAVGGVVDIRGSSVGLVSCSTGGTLVIEQSNVKTVEATSCTVTLRRNRMVDEASSTLVDVEGGKVIIENSLFTSVFALSDPLRIVSTTAGSRFSFNTVVNFASSDETANVLRCNGGLDVSSNIFAWHSSLPAAIGCNVHDSLFDELTPSTRVGSNHQASAATIFADLNGHDLHLSPTSPARGVGQRGIVMTDLEGKPRPMPSGTAPDVGAYEAP